VNFSEIPLTYGIMTVLWYIVSEEGRLSPDGFIMVSLWVFVKHQMMFYVLNFLVEILLILIHDLGSTDLTRNDSPFHVMLVVGLEVQITTCFRYTFVASLGPLFMTKMSKNGRVSLASTPTANLTVGLRLLRW
jgi:hypothetical protein